MSLEEVRERSLFLLRLDIDQFRAPTEGNEQNRAAWRQAVRTLAACGVLQDEDARTLIAESAATWAQSWEGRRRGGPWHPWRVINTVLLVLVTILVVQIGAGLLASLVIGNRWVSQQDNGVVQMLETPEPLPADGHGASSGAGSR